MTGWCRLYQDKSVTCTGKTARLQYAEPASRASPLPQQRRPPADLGVAQGAQHHATAGTRRRPVRRHRQRLPHQRRPRQRRGPAATERRTGRADPRSQPPAQPRAGPGLRRGPCQLRRGSDCGRSDGLRSVGGHAGRGRGRGARARAGQYPHAPGRCRAAAVRRCQLLRGGLAHERAPLARRPGGAGGDPARAQAGREGGADRYRRRAGSAARYLAAVGRAAARSFPCARLHAGGLARDVRGGGLCCREHQGVRYLAHRHRVRQLGQAHAHAAGGGRGDPPPVAAGAGRSA
ncbi:hypothetical protein D3C72_1428940 [compost metagenome]